MSETSPANSLPPGVAPTGCELASPGVNLVGVKDALMSFLGVAGLVHLHLFNAPLVITSAVDKLHVTHSKHYEGAAVDLRVSDKRPTWQAAWVLVLRVLADRFGLTVFDESNLPGQPHIHMEIAW